MCREGRSFSRQDGYSERELLLAGSDHLEASARLFETNVFWFLDSAGYLASLGFELFLKAALLHCTDQFPASHNLVYLAKCFQRALNRKLPDEQVALLKKLNRFGRLRYPDPGKAVSIHTGDLDNIDKLFLALVRQFPPSLVVILLRIREFDPDGLLRKGDRVVMFKRVETQKPPSG